MTVFRGNKSKLFLWVRQNLHFADNRKDDKKDNNFKMKPVIDHLNSKFSKMLLSGIVESIDEHMVKFKCRSVKSKPIKWGFKLWFRYWGKCGCLYQVDIFLGKKQTPEFNLGLGEEVVLQLKKDLEQSFCTVYFDNFFNSPKLIEKYSKKAFMVLEQFEPTESKCQKLLTISRWKGETASSFL